MHTAHRSPLLVLFACTLVTAVATISTAAAEPGAPGSMPRRTLSTPSAGVMFERNEGQTAPQVKFLARRGLDVVYLTGTQAVFSLTGAGGARSSVRLSFAGSRAARAIEALEPFDGRVHYLSGGAAVPRTRDVRTFAKVRYAGVYRGIDLIYYSNHEGELEYDFVVAPGADPGAIGLRFEGTDRVALEEDGTLSIDSGGRTLRKRQPVAYQVLDGERRQVSAAYRLDRRGIVRFVFGSYDRARPLVVDPVVLFSTYLGGPVESNPARRTAVAVDPLGNTYVAGQTSSLEFPTTLGALQPVNGGGDTWCTNCDGFVTKFSRTGAFVYSTYLGGSAQEGVSAIAVDWYGHVYVGGYTNSGDFPTTPGALRRSCPESPSRCSAGYSFVARLNLTGSALQYSTLVAPDSGVGSIAIDTAGRAIIGGGTCGAFPTTAGAFQAVRQGYCDAFVAKLDAYGSALVYATYFGGGGDDALADIALDPSGAIYLIGETQSIPTAFPLSANAFQRDCPRGSDLYADRCFIVFVAKLSADATALEYSTYLGGFGTPIAAIQGVSSNPGGIAVDAQGYAYVTGWAVTTDFPTTSGTLKPTTTTKDAFVAKLSQDGSALVYSTNLGGDVSTSGWDFGLGFDYASDIQIDAAGNAYVVGVTATNDFPLAGSPLHSSIVGEVDGFFAKLNASGSALVESSYLGTRTSYISMRFALDRDGGLHMAGHTWGLTLVNPAQTTPSPRFVARIGEVLPFATVTVNGTEGPAIVGAGDPLDIRMAFDANPLGPIPAGEVYIGLVAPSGTYWVDPSTFTFTRTRTVAFTGIIPSFGPSLLFRLPDAGVLPKGAYVPFLIVDTDTNGVPNGAYLHYSVIVVE